MPIISNTTAELNKFTYYFSISSSLFIFSIGIIGNILNIIIFTSLKTFRKNPCAFCLLLLSISDSGFLVFSTVTSTFRDLFQQFSDINTVLFCKISIFFAQTFALFSHSILCLTVIDQYLSTSKIQRRNAISFKHVQWFIPILVCLCILHGFPFFIYYDEQIIPGTSVSQCRILDTNGTFAKYLYFGVPVVAILLPVSIMTTFALLSLRNIRSMAKQRVPIIRLRIEQQITSMVLTKIFSLYISVVPFLLFYLIRNVILRNTNNLLIQQELFIASRLFNFLLYVNYAVNKTLNLNIIDFFVFNLYF